MCTTTLDPTKNMVVAFQDYSGMVESVPTTTKIRGKPTYRGKAISKLLANLKVKRGIKLKKPSNEVCKVLVADLAEAMGEGNSQDDKGFESSAEELMGDDPCPS